MSYLPTYALGTVVALALLATLVWVLRASVERLLTEMSESPSRSRFWGWVAVLWLGIVGVVAATSRLPYDRLDPGDNLQLYALIGQLRLFLLAVLLAVILLAYFVGRAVRRYEDRVHPLPPRYVPLVPGYNYPPAPPPSA